MGFLRRTKVGFDSDVQFLWMPTIQSSGAHLPTLSAAQALAEWIA